MNKKRAVDSKKKSTFVKIGMNVILIANIVLFAFGASVIYSIAKTKVNVLDLAEIEYNQNNILDLNDDTIDYYVNVTIENNGIYPIDHISLDVESYVHNTTNELILPVGTLFAITSLEFVGIAPNNQSTLKIPLQVMVDVGPGLLVDCWLRNEFDIKLDVAQIPMNISGDYFTEFDMI